MMLVSVFLVLLGAVSTVSQSSQPNILYLLVDDLGWSDVGYHGSEIMTPTIDRMAGEGVKLESYYVQPLCTPSRGQLLFGRYSIYTGMQHLVQYASQPHGHPLEFVSVAERLRDNGYRTAMVGKWHLGFFKSEYTPTYRGFDTFYGMYNGAGDHYNHEVTSLIVVGPTGVDWHDNSGTNMTAVFDEDPYYSTVAFTDRVIDIVDEHDFSSQPLFMYLPYQAMHTPLQVPDKYYDMYPDIDDEVRRRYAAMMTCIDESIANITAAYEAKGILDNTIIIFSTDNGGPTAGGAMNLPLRGQKKTTFEGGMRGVGWVWSDLLETTQGTESMELMHISDWFPTLVNLAGGSTDDLTLDGFDIWPTISRGEPSPRTEILHVINPLWLPRGNNTYPEIFNTRTRAALRVGDYKIITGVPYAGIVDNGPDPLEEQGIEDLERRLLGMEILDPEFQDVVGKDPDEPWGKNLWLFNIREDPNEETDLSEERTDIVESMLQRLAEYNEGMVPARFPFPDPDSNPENRGGAWTPWMD